jgi:hypothetical protein
MLRFTPTAILAAVLGAMMIAPAAAQFGSIFEDLFGAPPRPPSGLPGGPPQGGPPPGGQGGRPPQQQQYPPNSFPPPGGVQSRPLPPPPGTAAIDPAQRNPQAQQRPRPPQPGDTGPQPGDEVVSEPPSQKIVNASALFSGLDKITGRIINFDVAIGETVQFGALQLTPRACYTRPSTETANTDAFVEVDEVTLRGEVKRIFTGWVFAASPGLHAVEHPIYDLWLTDCKGPATTAQTPPPPPPTTASTQPVRPPAQPKAQPKQQPKQQPTAQQQPPQQQPGFGLFR